MSPNIRELMNRDPAELDELLTKPDATDLLARRKSAVHATKATSSASQRLSMAFIIIGVVGAAITISWALLVWHYDTLITPRGGITVTLTTTCVMFVFLGTLKYWRAHDAAESHKHWAPTVDIMQRQPEVIIGAVKTLVEYMDAFELERLRRDHRLLEQVEELREEMSLFRNIAEPGKAGPPRHGSRRRRRNKPAAQSFEEYLAARADVRRELDEGPDPVS